MAWMEKKEKSPRAGYETNFIPLLKYTPPMTSQSMLALRIFHFPTYYTCMQPPSNTKLSNVGGAPSTLHRIAWSSQMRAILHPTLAPHDQTSRLQRPTYHFLFALSSRAMRCTRIGSTARQQSGAYRALPTLYDADYQRLIPSRANMAQISTEGLYPRSIFL